MGRHSFCESKTMHGGERGLMLHFASAKQYPRTSLIQFTPPPPVCAFIRAHHCFELEIFLMLFLQMISIALEVVVVLLNVLARVAEKIMHSL